jgi:hypothetical protein
MQAEHQLKASLIKFDDLKATLNEHAIVAITGPQKKGHLRSRQVWQVLRQVDKRMKTTPSQWPDIFAKPAGVCDAPKF